MKSNSILIFSFATFDLACECNSKQYSLYSLWIVFLHRKLKPAFNIKTIISWFCVHTISFLKSGLTFMAFMTVYQLFLFKKNYEMNNKFKIILNIVKELFCLLLLQHALLKFLLFHTTVFRIFISTCFIFFQPFQSYNVGSTDLGNRKLGCIL